MSIKNRTFTACILLSILSLLFLLPGCFDDGVKIKMFLKEIDNIGNGYMQNEDETPLPGSNFACYVSNSGNDFYDGTQAMPVKTLRRAAQILRAQNVLTKYVYIMDNLTSTATDTIDNTGRYPIIITTNDGNTYNCAAPLVIGAGSTVDIIGTYLTFSGQLTVSGNLTLSGTHAAPMTVYLATGKKITMDSFSCPPPYGVTIIPAVYNAGLQVLAGSGVSSDFSVQNQILSGGNTIAWHISANCLEPQAEYHVSPTGDDANDGLSTSSPFKTLHRAFNLVVSIQGAQDKTINVSGTLNFATEGAAGGDLESVFRLNTNSADTITIKGGELSASGSPSKRVMHIARGKIKFEGITFSGGNNVPVGAGVYIENVNSVVDFTGCSFTGNTTSSSSPPATSGKDIFKKEGTLTINGGAVPVGASTWFGGTDNVYVVL